MIDRESDAMMMAAGQIALEADQQRARAEAAEAECRTLRAAVEETAAILKAAVVAGRVGAGDSYRIGGVYLQTVSDALDAADAALAGKGKDKTA